MNAAGLFYRKKPLFGFDIGHANIKVVQLGRAGKKTTLEGYGSVEFKAESIKDGEIINFDGLAVATEALITKNLTGSITTNRIAASLPVLHTFSRIINLPPMADKDVMEAVRLEAEQYIPVPIAELYLDYQAVGKNADSQDFLVSAAPKRVVDSYAKLFDGLGLELVCMEPSILSVTRTVQKAEDSNPTTLVIDCGSVTTDLIIYNQSTVRVTGTIKFGGDTITESLGKAFNVSYQQANDIKIKHGLDAGEKQAEISKALNVPLKFLIDEIKKIIRFFEERDKGQNVKVQQIILLGGGANLPGFSTYLTSQLRIPTRLISIWKHIDSGRLPRPSQEDASMYATAAGLALINPKDAIL